MYSGCEECCGKCHFHQRRGRFGTFECVNAASPYFSELTEYDDICDEFSERGSARVNSAIYDFDD